MKWTSDRPEESGWYWFKESENAMREIVRFSPNGTFARVDVSGEQDPSLYPHAEWSEEPIRPNKT